MEENKEFISLDRKNEEVINLDKERISGEDIKNIVDNSDSKVEVPMFKEEVKAKILY